VADVARSKQHNKSIDAKTTFATRNLVAVPVRAPGPETRPIGVVEVLNKRRGPFTKADQTLLELLASQAAAAIEMSRLQRAAALSSLAHRLGDVGHDVKNLLTPVETGTRTIAQVLSDALDALEMLRGSLPDELAEVLDVTIAPLRDDVKGLHEIVLEAVADVKDRVREIAEAVKGIASEPTFEPTDLRALVASVLRVLYPVAEPSGVALDFAGVPAVPVLPLLMLDRRRMYNALYNLVHTAVAATPSGGTVRVIASHGGHGGGGDRLRLVVADDGSGIPPAVLRTLFTDETVSTKVGGTGLGTRIVQQVARAHGGEVRVESVVGQGATFTLDLPWRPAP
jgi:signal transduction histidine kinase